MLRSHAACWGCVSTCSASLARMSDLTTGRHVAVSSMSAIAGSCRRQGRRKTSIKTELSTRTTGGFPSRAGFGAIPAHLAKVALPEPRPGEFQDAPSLDPPNEILECPCEAVSACPGPDPEAEARMAHEMALGSMIRPPTVHGLTAGSSNVPSTHRGPTGNATTLIALDCNSDTTRLRQDPYHSSIRNSRHLSTSASATSC